MKYIQNAPFINVITGETLQIEYSTPEEVLNQNRVFKEAYVTDVLLLVCNNYVPAPGQVLSIQEVRKFHSVMTTLESAEDHIQSWILFSEEELGVLIKICSWTLPRMAPVLLRNTDSLLEILETALEKIPEEVGVDENAQR